MVTTGQRGPRYSGPRRLLQFFDRLFVIVLPLRVDQIDFNSVAANGRSMRLIRLELAICDWEFGFRSDGLIRRNESNDRPIERLPIERHSPSDGCSLKRLCTAITSRRE